MAGDRLRGRPPPAPGRPDRRDRARGRALSGLGGLLRTARARAAVAVLVAALAAGGIVIPGLSDDSGGSSPDASQAPAGQAGSPPAEGSAIPGEEGAAIGATLAAIESGEPLPYEEDGGTFENREGLLPDRPLGYYREYTVETPGSPDRGARRLVIGEGGETYYTGDHYASFTRIEHEDYL